ncbi:MAG: transposase [Acidobacteria bacterium]|nr:transposase [Acidobacteriota bacterium]
MAVPPRRTKDAGTYFVTSRTWESRKLFIKPAVCEIVIGTLLHYREKHSYLPHSFVLMPDHIHVMLTPSQEITLERAVQFIKGGSSRRISQALNFQLPVWQRGYTDHRIRDAQDYQTHLRYIEQNPVKVKLVLSASEYPWSSAPGAFAMDDCPQGLKPMRKAEPIGTVETVPLRRA